MDDDRIRRFGSIAPDTIKPIVPERNVPAQQQAVAQALGRILGNVTGVSDAARAARGEMTPEQQRDFALMSSIGLIAPRAVGAATGLAKEFAPGIAKAFRSTGDAAGGMGDISRALDTAYGQSKQRAIDTATAYANSRQPVSATFEQTPGKSTGLMPKMIGAPFKKQQEFSERAPWAESDFSDPGNMSIIAPGPMVNKSLGDPIYRSMGMRTEPTAEGRGFYVNSAGQTEINPVSVARPNVWTPLNEQGDRVVSQRDVARLNAGEATRGLMDFQEGAAWNKVLPGTGPGRSSLDIDMGRMPNEQELMALHDVANKHGFVMANSDHGVSFLNFDPNETTNTVGTKLLGDLGKDLKTSVPDAKVTQGSLSSGYIDYSTALARENAGQGLATKQLVDHLENLRNADPLSYEGLMHSAGVAGKAEDNLRRIGAYGGAGERPDYETLLSTIGKGGLQGLMDRIKTVGYAGLPAAAGAASLGYQDLIRDEAQPEQ